MDRWHLNAIILSHVNRVFAAASFVASSSADVDEGTMVSLMGNLLWASSPYLADDAGEEAMMAFGGAVAGTLGPAFVGHRGGSSNDAAEVEFRNRHDDLVEMVWDSLVEAGLDRSDSYATVNAHVWGVLFPQLRYAQSFRALARQIAQL
jgi:hypothetical protein